MSLYADTMAWDTTQYFLLKKYAQITDGLCVSFGGAPKPPFQGRERGLNKPSSFTDWSPNNCISNKQTTFLLLQHFFLWGLCCSTQRWWYELLGEVSGQTGFWFQLDARQRKIAGSQHTRFCCKPPVSLLPSHQTRGLGSPQGIFQIIL